MLKAILLLLPAAVLIVSMWATMMSLYTLPFRSGRGYFLTALLMSWWDVGRMAWFYWAGMGRFLFVLVGLDRQPDPGVRPADLERASRVR